MNNRDYADTEAIGGVGGQMAQGQNPYPYQRPTVPPNWRDQEGVRYGQSGIRHVQTEPKRPTHPTPAPVIIHQSDPHIQEQIHKVLCTIRNLLAVLIAVAIAAIFVFAAIGTDITNSLTH